MPFQEDMFETRERVYLKELQERKARLRDELEAANKEIVDVVRRGKANIIGPGLFLQKHSSGEVFLYGDKGFFAIVSIDLLAEAVENLKLEKHDEPKGIPATDRGETSHSSW